jgi:shikimate kinase
VSIVVVGLPAAGKSSVAAILARRLGLPHTDTHDAIEQAAGRAIADIFAEDGEEGFRRIEEAVVAAALAGPEAVISLGGGSVLSPATRARLKDHEVIWLDVSVATATRRAGLAKLRPLLLGDVRRQLEALNAERAALYAEVADLRVDVNRVNPRQAASEIMALTGRTAAKEETDD